MMDNWPYTVKFTGKPGKSSTVEMGGDGPQIVVCGYKHKMNVECVES